MAGSEAYQERERIRKEKLSKKRESEKYYPLQGSEYTTMFEREMDAKKSYKDTVKTGKF